MPEKRNPSKDPASNLEVTPVMPRNTAADRTNKRTAEKNNQRQIPELTVEPVIARRSSSTGQPRPHAAKQTEDRRAAASRPTVRENKSNTTGRSNTSASVSERPVRHSESVSAAENRARQNSPQRPRVPERSVKQTRENAPRAARPLEETQRIQPVPSHKTTPPQKRSAPQTNAAARKIADEASNIYRPEDPKKALKEKQLAQRQKELLERRRRIDEEMSLFAKSDKPKNYFVNLLLVTVKMTLICILIIGISGIGFVLGMAKSYLESVPELDIALVSGQDQATVLYDVNGEVLGNYYSLENREWAKLDEIPLNLQNAVIAIEDVRFRRHMGIDFKRLLASAISNLSSGSLQGGSTITQQLIKNTILSFEQTYKRKIQEASLALELEKNYSKDEILEAYLNTIYMGGSCYGMKTAAMDYFGKSLSDLTLRECATLAGMIQNPSRYNPRSNYFSRNNPDRTDNRTNLVLYEMYENGLIGQEEYEAAKNDTITVLEDSPYSSKTGMIYFTDYVIDSVVDELLEIRGLEDNTQNRGQIRTEIRTEGYHIYTTLDAEKQTAAEEAVYSFTGYPNMRYSSDAYTIAGRNPDGTVIRLTQPQAAVAVMDYRNGYITALVGGRQAPGGSLEFNRSYQSTMPVGSSIKPLSVYGPAIEIGAGPGTIYYNLQMRIDGWDSPNGYPLNNSRTYSGPITMRSTMTSSHNVTAAQALMYDVGLDRAYDTLVQLGVDPEHISKTGSGLALGSSGITPLEMAGAFSCIANMGVYNEPIAFTKLEDKNGNVIVDMLAKQDTHRVFSESTAWQLIDQLYTVVNSGATRARVSGQTVYGKTGTNSEMRGVFFAGFTGYYTGTVWIGSDAYKPLVSDAQGGKYAAPLFSAVMTALHQGLPNKAATEIQPGEVGVSRVAYCDVSGKLASSSCPSTHMEYGNPANMETCDIHKTVKICNESGALATAACPEENCSERTLVMVPQRGVLNYMYYNYYSTFVKYAGTPTTNMSSCTIHTAQE